MIEDKEKGTLIAENPEEALWWNLTEETKAAITKLKGRMAKAQSDLKLGAREIEQKFKKGAKGAIKNLKDMIFIQKEILKMAETKLGR